MVFCLLSLCVILTLATTSHSLSCIECTDATDAPCTGEEKTCLPDEVCLSRYTVTSVGGVILSKLFVRGCGKRSQCSVVGSASMPHASVLTSTNCCFTNRCTAPRPVLPSQTTEKNGVMCMSCQAMGDSPCDSNIYRDCTGSETKCISQVTKSSELPSAAFRGCATPTLCNIPHEEGTFGPHKFSSDTICTDGAASLHYCLSLLAVTFLCLFKVMN